MRQLSIGEVDDGASTGFQTRIGRLLRRRVEGPPGASFKAKVEIVSTAGLQAEAGWLSFIGLSYDPKHDSLEIALNGLHHRVRDPLGLYADEQPGVVLGIEIVAHGGMRHVVRFDPPLPAGPVTQPGDQSACSPR
jgi:hypothetical protein